MSHKLSLCWSIAFVWILWGFPITAFSQSSNTSSNTERTDPRTTHPAPLSPFSDLRLNTAKCFSGYRSLLHIAGAAATWGIQHTDMDYDVHRYFYQQGKATQWFIPAAVIGMVGPVALGTPMFFKGRKSGDVELQGAGCAVLQATLISLSYISVLKAITGRPHPDPEEYADMREASKTWRFGIGKGGIFWGWPSGHAGVTMAVMSSLTAYYPDQAWTWWVGGLTVAYMTVGVCAFESGSMHWFSDAVAGNLMGYAIGSATGKAFRKKVAGISPDSETGRIHLTAYPGGIGATFAF